MTLNLESGLLSRAEPLCGAIAPFTEVRFPNILHTAKANICSDILGCSKFPEMMHYCIGISNYNQKSKEINDFLTYFFKLYDLYKHNNLEREIFDQAISDRLDKLEK